MNKAEQVLCGNKSATRIMDLSARWHRQQIAIDNQIRDFSESDIWPALSEPQTHGVPGNLAIRPLTSTEELQAEGARMNHCVGGYSRACMLEGSHILAIETAAGKPLSTVEICETGDPNSPLEVEQHFAYDNEDPGDPSIKALEWYMNGIRKGSIEVDWDGIAAAREKANAADASNEILKRTGFDPFDAERRERAFEAFKEFLPKSQRSLTLDAWLEKTGIEQTFRKDDKEDLSLDFLDGNFGQARNDSADFEIGNGIRLAAEQSRMVANDRETSDDDWAAAI